MRTLKLQCRCVDVEVGILAADSLNSLSKLYNYLNIKYAHNKCEFLDCIHLGSEFVSTTELQLNSLTVCLNIVFERILNLIPGLISNALNIPFLLLCGCAL